MNSENGVLRHAARENPCCGVISEAQILFFDEPMIGLDPKAIRTFKELALQHRRREFGRVAYSLGGRKRFPGGTFP
ncbi:MAG: hypothetical protein ACYCV0_04595 [Desulfitobacteriaceae bacterium]